MPNWYHGSNSLITKFTVNHSRTYIDLGPGVYFANNSNDCYPERPYHFMLANYYDYPTTYYEPDNNDPEWFHDNDDKLIAEIPIDNCTGLRMMGTTWNYRCGNPKYLDNYEVDVLCSRIQKRRGTQFCFRTERAMKYLNMFTELDTVWAYYQLDILDILRKILANPYLCYNSARLSEFKPPISCTLIHKEEFDKAMASEEVAEYVAMYKQVCELMHTYLHVKHAYPNIESWDSVALKFND